MWSIRAKLQVERRTGDLAIFNLAIDSKLIGCDLVALRVDEVTCRPTGTLSTDQLSAEEKGSGRPLRTERSHTPGAGRLPAGERPESGRMPAPESTVRYLGVEVDDALDIAERIDVLITGAELPRSALRLATVNDRPSAHVSIDFRVLWFGYCAGVNPWRRMTSAIFA